jgi:[acyl-carrier-protein] S-malonyltransferase
VSDANRLALVFPGQASQAVGMGVDLRESSARARELFALADAITGLPITELCESGPLERLTATEVAQPAVVVTSLAALAMLRQHAPGLDVAAVAGHSVGEFAACVAAGALDDQAALRLVHARAQAMAAACSQVDGTMAAVIGLDEDALRAACAEVAQDGSSVELANLNAPGQLIVSGDRAALERFAQRAKAAGARRVLPLNVGGPFHSVYMRPAAAALEAAVSDAPFVPAQVPLVANVTAEPITAPDDLRRELSMQVYSPVRWIDSLQRMAALGCSRFVEVGPGEVLAGLIKRTLPDAKVVSMGSLAALEAARELVSTP